MGIIDRYLMKAILGAALIIASVVAVLFIIFTLLAELRHLGHGSYGLLQALEYVILILPSNLSTAFPVIALMGSLLGLGLLANHHELIALRASGMSYFGMMRSVMMAGLVLAAIGFLISAYVGPKLSEMGELSQAESMDHRAILVTAHSVWLKQDDSFFLIGSVISPEHLKNVQRFLIKDHQLVQIDQVTEAVYQKPLWQLSGVNIIQFQDKQVKSQYQDQTTWQGLITPDILRVLVRGPQNLTFFELWSYIHFEEKTGINAIEYELSFWQTIFQPLAVLIMTVLALPFVSGAMRSLHQGLRMVLGLGFGFVFFIANQFFGPLTLLYSFPPVLAAGIPTACFGVLVFLALRSLK